LLNYVRVQAHMAAKNNQQPFKSVCYVNALRALPSILQYYLLCEDRPALKIINLVKEKNNSGVFAPLPQGASQQLPYIEQPPRKRTAA